MSTPPGPVCFASPLYACIITPTIARTCQDHNIPHQNPLFMVCTHSCPTQPHPKANPTGLAGGDGGIVGHQIAWQGRKLVEHHQSTWPLLPSCLVLMG